MSWLPCPDPSSTSPSGDDDVVLVLEGKARDLGGFGVRRVLPAAARRSLGPFVFLDEMGPATFPPGGGVDVRPHPHIGLSTVTWMLEGAMHHRDSTGADVPVQAGELDWMTSGRGITHSERTPEADRAGAGARMHGLQFWVALPVAHEEDAPSFQHLASSSLPMRASGGAEVRVLAGEAWGLRSPVRVHSPLFLLDVRMEAGATLRVPDEHAERGVYVVHGSVGTRDRATGPGHLLVLREGAEVVLRALVASHVVVFGGAPHPEPRHMEWNFVSSRRERIDEAKAAWRAGRFPVVPGDDREFIPLPDDAPMVE